MTDYTPPIPAEADGADPDDKTVVRPRRKAAAPAPAATPVEAPEAAVAPPVEPAAPVEAAAPVAAVAPVEAVAPVAPAAPVEAAAPVTPAAPVAPSAPVAQPNPYAAPQQQYRAPQAAKGLSVASMIFGVGGLLLSFFGFGFLINVAAVVTGHLASKRQPHAKGFWLTGIITGYLGIAFSLVYGAIWANYFYLLLS